jgi:hypothetical protein
MMAPDLVPVPSPVLRVGHFSRALLVYSCQAPKSWDDLAVLKPEIRIALLASSKKIPAMGESRFVGESVERGASAVNPDYIATTESLVSLVTGWV